jgi:hypothetical protein
LDLRAATVPWVHYVLAYDRECLADAEEVGVNEEPDVRERRRRNRHGS